MSCNQKLLNNSGLTAFDNAFKNMTATATQFLSPAAKLTTINNNLNSIKSDISNKIATQVNNYLGQITGKIDGIKNFVAGIDGNIQSLGQSFVNSFKQAEQTLVNQYTALDNLLECEITNTQNINSTTAETSTLQSKVLSIGQQSISSASNTIIKDISENEFLKSQYISNLTDTTMQDSASLINSTTGNGNINLSQINSIDKLALIS